MANAQMNLRIDEDVKRKMDATAAAIGTTSAAAMNIFARQFVAVGGFPFDVKIPRNVEIPRIDRSKLYQPEKTPDGSPVLPSEWLDQEGDVYDGLA
ncbi:MULTISPECIES: type II toxin-antitoxin system RelB/DinJ family antitoxin [Gordonibacter]|uniref:type II toxin-antitoxin system RelB/DinJ family antitoxin n=1 Tax=Gordonibacter TaxID=644652 RepID=UPI001DF4BA8A|nr:MULTISPECIES: type II toxin-antitoxin system RelB/DinJ family antitoxin [Gordonibacter]MDN4508892.1 type II toxin-antitoxin system RelB/DinJ family antitoxin [Gordonibacter sp. RACS_AR49]HJF63415.1 type II toxin-antitoxin system RelB/DinJ family antitoxin [Gordonibacter urolithinfaciens]